MIAKREWGCAHGCMMVVSPGTSHHDILNYFAILLSMIAMEL